LSRQNTFVLYLLLSVTLLLSGCISKMFSPSASPKSAAADRISAEEFNQRVIQAPGTVIVDFYAEWCGPCKRLGPIVEEIARERPDVHVVKVNVDENPNLCQTYRIQSIPHLFLFRGGQVVPLPEGFQEKNAIMQFIGPPPVVNGVSAVR